MFVLYLYLAGLPLGFLLAAVKRDNWWKTNPDRSYSKDEWGGELAALITFLWLIPLTGLLIYHTAMLFYRIFMILMNGSISSADRASNFLKKLKTWKSSKRKRIVVPSAPVVKWGGYREGATRPCIACGAETSIDQSGMECVESAEAQHNRLDI
jgi:hypothetical protein